MAEIAYSGFAPAVINITGQFCAVFGLIGDLYKTEKSLNFNTLLHLLWLDVSSIRD